MREGAHGAWQSTCEVLVRGRRRRPAPHDHRLLLELAPCQERERRERMPLRESRVEPLFPQQQRPDANVFQQVRITYDDVHMALVKRLDQPRIVAFDAVDFDLRKISPVARYECLKRSDKDRRADSEAQTSDFRPPRACGALECLLKIEHQSTRPRQELPPCRCEADAVTMALKQRNTEIVLQAVHLAAERGTVHAENFRRARVV